MRTSRITSILGSLRTLSDPVRVHGSTVSSRAYILARWAVESDFPIVILCTDDDAAAALAADVTTLGQTFLSREIETIHLPTWEKSPLSSVAPSLRVRLERISALHQLKLAKGGSVILTTLAGSFQASLPKETLEASTLRLHVGQSVESREAVTRSLIEAGYLRVDPVEDPGTFAVRGEIIDIFPPAAIRPLRIELFDNEIERIREFDPASQRAAPDAAGNLTNLAVPPAREVLINVVTLSRVRERLKNRADDLGISRSIRDPIILSLADGTYPDHSDAWAAFAYDTPATLWDHLPSQWPVVWNDELGCTQEWDKFLTAQLPLAEQLSTSGVLVPTIDEIYRATPDLEREIKSRSRLYLDQVELTDAASLSSDSVDPSQSDTSALASNSDDRVSLRHQIAVKTNQDLSSGSKQSLGVLEPKFRLWITQGLRVWVVSTTQSQSERIRFLLSERSLASQLGGKPEPGLITLGIGTLSEGFRWPAEGLIILTEGEVLGVRPAKKARRSRTAESGSAAKNWSGLQALADLSLGDAVVHVDHGIGRYQGLVRLSLSGAPADFLLLEYAGKDKLYLPVYRLNVIQKYVGAADAALLDKLGSQAFSKAKEKVKDAVKKLAFDLVQLYAERKITPGVVFSGRDAEYRAFESQFAFEETPDQLKAIDDALSDMESGRVMDRLVCGDVGYGKTEVAIRAAFRAVSDGKQVVVLVPTTVLAHQHEQSFRARMKEYPIIIESVSRFKSARDQKTVLAAVAEGKVDIIVGTHRLLSRDVKFRDLGLIIVDEEHRFGVEHKERLKTLKVNTHVLTLTATPIPRTLHMALAGLRDISLINTPPVDRLPIRTYVSRFDEALIKQAIETELSRGGQVFFVNNRVQSIYEIANRIKELVPAAQVAVGHGQMKDGALEEAMIDFYQKRANVLVCTSIIESGLDLPSANTILVNRADSFGLAQLYQIRGRVGRGQARAYAYLLLPSEGAITDDAKKRLEVIQRFVELGSGFSIASHDLEIRGGGDLLGPQQSGHIATVGFDLYTELLDEAIRELEGKPLNPEDSRREPEIKAPFPAYLAEEYVPDVHQRLSLYRRFSGAAQEAEIDSLEEELQDRFGPLPVEALNLLWLIRIKQLLKKIGVEALTVGTEKVSLVPGPGSQLDPVRAIALISSNPQKYQLTPDSKFVARLPVTSLRDLFFGLEGLLKDLLPRKKA